MPSQLIDSTQAKTVADLWEQLGQVPLERILISPPPGTATEIDLLALLNGPEKRICELVDGVLVEKPMGLFESVVATCIIRLLTPYFDRHDPGILSGPDGPFRLTKGVVRLPDICFVSWAKIPDRANWIKSIADLAPDLAIEVLSPSNTRKEMDRKLKEYFDAGTQLVWYIDPRKRSAVSYTSPDSPVAYADDALLDASPVLPGFTLSLRRLFEMAGNAPSAE